MSGDEGCPGPERDKDEVPTKIMSGRHDFPLDVCQEQSPDNRESHCEEPSDEAIRLYFPRWIASRKAHAMTTS
jgi:hypothetical protein